MWRSGRAVLTFPAAHESITSFTARESLHKRTHRERDARTSGVRCESLSCCFTITFPLFLEWLVAAKLGICFTFSLHNFDSWVQEAAAAAAKVTVGAVIRRRFDTRPGEEAGLSAPLPHTWTEFIFCGGGCGQERIELLWPSGGFAMTSRRRSSAKLKLRRSLSEQLRSSTSKAWDLLWRNVRERRLAGQ